MIWILTQRRAPLCLQLVMVMMVDQERGDDAELT